MTSALAFSEIAAGERTALMRLAIDDALTKARALDPRRAAPVRVPRELPVVLLLTLGLIAVAELEVRTLRPLPPERRFEPIAMTADDLELFRGIAEELEQKSQDPEAQAAVRRFNQLIEDIAERRLDRREVFERLERLERELAKGAEADRNALEEGLQNIARELEKSELSRPVAEALKQKKLADAEKALRELSEKLRKKPGAPNKAELDRLRNALAKASRVNSENKKNIEQRRAELEEQRKSLLKKQQPDGGASGDRNLLKKKERQLERLDREREQAERSSRQLSRLDRELAKAAEDLMRELGAGADDLDRGAEDINRMAKQEMTEQEKQQLSRRLQELRELIRQQGQGGKQRLQRLMRFGERARGNGGGNEKGQGQANKPGDKGQKQGSGAGQSMRIGKGDDLLILPGGQSPGSMPGQASGSGMSGGSQAPGNEKGGGEGAGQAAGSGHNPNLKGDPSSLKGATKDVTAVAQDTGQGTASSEVIFGAAERGFVGRGYQKVYTDYKSVAESVMNQQQIPPGYRFYVQRYFQLIRPRE